MSAAVRLVWWLLWLFLLPPREVAWCGGGGGVCVEAAAESGAATAGGGLWEREPITTSGSLRGRVVQTQYGAVAQFLGVKFAEVPERFSAARPFAVEDPMRVVDADAFAPKCPQPPHRPEFMHSAMAWQAAGRGAWAEDCLFLNVFAPAAPPPLAFPDGRPLLLWLPGEGFCVADAALLDASALAARADTVVVTAAYRLGAFGFLSVGNASLSGNAAVSDAVAALRWVESNARAFGADPSRIALGGHFTGATLAALAAASPAARADLNLLNGGVAAAAPALQQQQQQQQQDASAEATTDIDKQRGGSAASCPFLRSDVGCGDVATPPPLARRLVLLSGLPATPLAVDPTPADAFVSLARATGCAKGGVAFQQSLACMRAVSAEHLLSVSGAGAGAVGGGRLVRVGVATAAAWRPVVDAAGLVPMDLLRAVRRGALPRVAALVGDAQNEGALCVLRHLALESAFAPQIAKDNITRKEFAALVREHLLDALKTQEQSLVDATTHEYKAWADGGTRNFRSQFLRFCGAVLVRAPGETFARALARRGNAVWRYEWAHRPAASTHPAFLGAAHGDDLPFLFGLQGRAAAPAPGAPRPPDGDHPAARSGGPLGAEESLSLQLMDAVGNFLKRGNPNPEGSSTWPQFVDSTRQMRVFAAAGPLTKSSDFLSQDVDFWGQVAPSILRAAQQRRGGGAGGGRGGGGCARGGQQLLRNGSASSSSWAQNDACDNCGVVTGLVTLSVILSVALALHGLHLVHSRLKGPVKNLLTQEHLPQ